jgi:hypothetical protein
MPQFDKITFFTQIFWLSVIFFGFYFLMLQVFLPKIASVLKIRKKKLLMGADGVSTLNKEYFSIIIFRNNFVQNFISDSKNELILMGADGILWLLDSVLDINILDLVDSQLSYLIISGSILTTDHFDIDD